MSEQLIHTLPDHIVNQIAAGEIVHNPAYVLKELLENAIDSGATCITVTWRYSGKSYLSVTDNGQGMSKSDLQLCSLPHTTSKLNINDLLDIHTFGFRGEALASIASVSKLTITSRLHHDSEQGYRWTNEQGKSEVSLYPSLFGTSIMMKDLFYNIPARMNFLQSDQKEHAKLLDMYKTFAMAYPQVEFILKTDKKTKATFLKLSNDFSNETQHTHRIIPYVQRIGQIFGTSLQDQLFSFIEEWETGYAIGIFSKPTYYISSRSHLYYFVNHRMVQDKVYPFMVRNIYQDLIPKQTYPFGVVLLFVKPQFVNINVHPNKLEVQFRKHFFPLQIIAGALKRTLLHHSKSVTHHMVDRFAQRLTSSNEQDSTMQTSFKSAISSKLSEDRTSKKLPLNRGSFIPQGYYDSLSKHSQEPSSYTLHQPTPAYHPLEGIDHRGVQNSDLLYQLTSEEHRESHVSQKINFWEEPYEILGQIFNTFILGSTSTQFFLIDQHAMHERILFEQLKKTFINKSLVTQECLVPVSMNISDEDYLLLSQHHKDMESIGMKFSLKHSSTSHSLSVHGWPALFAYPTIKQIHSTIGSICSMLHHDTWHKDYIINNGLGEMACHMAIQAGQKLHQEEFHALIKKIPTTPNIARCNHGRPTYMIITQSQLRRVFERTSS